MIGVLTKGAERPERPGSDSREPSPGVKVRRSEHESGPNADAPATM